MLILSHFWGLKHLKMPLKNGNRVCQNDYRWRIYDDDDPTSFSKINDDDDDARRHQNKNDGVMTIWLSALMTSPLVINNENM